MNAAIATLGSPCPICGASTQVAFQHVVLGRHKCSYEICDNCAFISARPANWLHEAYSSALALTDTGIVGRNESLAEVLTVFAWLSGLHRHRALDIGGGHGLLVRMLRDRGLDFRWSDQHADNIFARGFEDDGGSYSWVTLIEVFEHLLSPLEFFRAIVDKHQPEALFFTTEVKTVRVPPQHWWYWGFETGQHVGFASQRSLEIIAQRIGYDLVSIGGHHLLSRNSHHTRAFRAACSRLRAPLAALGRRMMRSRTMADHILLTQLPRR